MQENIFNDIEEFLKESLSMFNSINPKETISKVKIKNILENLRSSLEYSAHYISSLLENPKSRVYFPYTDNESDFENKVHSQLPNLKKEYPKLFDLIGSLQIFSSQNDWLNKLCKATNIAKHNQALNISQNTHTERTLNNISFDDFIINEVNTGKSNIQFSGNSLNGKKTDDLIIKNGEVESWIKNEIPAKFNFEIKENHIIIIEDIEVDLFEFIDRCINEINSYISKLNTLR